MCPYDYANRLASVSRNGTTLKTYTYDFSGLRLTATEGGVTTEYVYDLGGNIIAEASTNILTDNQTHVEGDTSGFSPYFAGVLSKTTTKAYQGQSSLQVVSDAINEGFHSLNAAALPAGTVVTGRARLWVPAGKQVRFGIRGKTPGGLNREPASITVAGNDDWQFVAVSYTLTEEWAQAGVQAHTSTLNADPNFTFYADDMALITNGPAPIKKSYIYALGKHLARVDGVVGDPAKPVYWYHTDHLGTVEAMTNQAGAVVWRGDVRAFGTNMTPGVQGIENTHIFTGKEWDTAVGLYYFNARWYDPELGRFVSEDPVGDPNNPNLYSYCADNPLKFTDSTGFSNEYGGTSGNYNQQEAAENPFKDEDDDYDVTNYVPLPALDEFTVQRQVHWAVLGGGDREIAEMQSKLAIMGFDICPCGVDGKFGPNTEKAVKDFQETFGLPANGELDSRTKASIRFEFELVARVATRKDYIWPTEGRINSVYGPRTPSVWYDNNGAMHMGSSEHKGIDIGNTLNTPVSSCADGTVVFSGWSTGNTVVVYHGDGVYSYYFHLNSVEVEVGQKVGQGQTVGLMGNTGGGTGVHLHFAMSVGDKMFVKADYVDPLLYLPTPTLSVKSSSVGINSNAVELSEMDAVKEREKSDLQEGILRVD